MTNVIELAVIQLLTDSKPAWAEINKFSVDSWHVVGIAELQQPQATHQDAWRRWVASFRVSPADSSGYELCLLAYKGTKGYIEIPLADYDLEDKAWEFLNGCYEQLAP